jgi:hypothetical protein
MRQISNKQRRKLQTLADWKNRNFLKLNKKKSQLAFSYWLFSQYDWPLDVRLKVDEHMHRKMYSNLKKEIDKHAQHII